MSTLCVCVSLLLLRRRAGLVQESGVVMTCMQMARELHAASAATMMPAGHMMTA